MGLDEADSSKNPEVENLVSESLKVHKHEIILNFFLT
jgi:hypothetical protein